MSAEEPIEPNAESSALSNADGLASPPFLPLDDDDGKDLSPQELVERLRLHSGPLVAEVHGMVRMALATEDQREAGLDRKATTLLGAVGLSLTLTFAFGGNILLGHSEYLEPLGAWGWRLAILFFGGALLVAALAGYKAWRALRIRGDYKGLAECDVFNPQVLQRADSKEDVEQERHAAYYKRYMTGNLWRIYRQHFRVHEDKAVSVKAGQSYFLAFLVLLLAVGLMLVWAGLAGGPKNMAKSSNNSPSSQPTSSSPPPPTPVPSGGVSVSKGGRPTPSPVPSGGKTRHDENR